MNKQITPEMKATIIDASGPIYADRQGTKIPGKINGRLLPFPFFRSFDGDINVEISWHLAYRATFEKAIIQL